MGGGGQRHRTEGIGRNDTNCLREHARRKAVPGLDNPISACSLLPNLHQSPVPNGPGRWLGEGRRGWREPVLGRSSLSAPWLVCDCFCVWLRLRMRGRIIQKDCATTAICSQPEPYYCLEERSRLWLMPRAIRERLPRILPHPTLP